MKISVCMIVRNEAKHLARALSSIPAGFEIVVVDTGSTDQTVQIAQSFGSKIGYYEWDQNFSNARNYSISLAEGDYILVMDADETLYESVMKDFDGFIAKYPNTAGSVTIRNYLDGEITVHQALRLFPNHPSFRFSGAVHETVQYNSTPATFQKTEIIMNHYGYNSQHYEETNKAQRYLELYHSYLESEPNNGYMLYQLGKLYYSIKQYEDAERAFIKCISQGEEKQSYYPVMLVMLGYALQELGRSQEAEQLLTPYIQQYQDFPDLFFLLGLLAMDTGKVSLIETYFLAAMHIGETTRYSSVLGVGSYKAAYNLGVFYEIFNRKQEAFRYYQQAASSKYKPAEERLKGFSF